jgi:hypothetical protein
MRALRGWGVLELKVLRGSLGVAEKVNGVKGDIILQFCL